MIRNASSAYCRARSIYAPPIIMTDRPLPTDFTRTIKAVYRQAGADWLAALPTLIAECARRWRLVVDEPFADLSYHFVAPARRADGTQAVLKQRIDIMADTLDLDRERVRAWGFCKIVLSAWWGLEDGIDGLPQCLAFADLMDNEL